MPIGTIAGIAEGTLGAGEERDLERRPGQALLGQPLHVRGHPRDEGERVDGDPLGTQADDLIEGVLEARFGLVGQPVDEVDVQRAEADGAGVVDQRPGLLVALDAVDRLLHLGREVLHAHRQPVEAERRRW